MANIPARLGVSEETAREMAWHLAKGLGPEEAARKAGLPSSSRLYHAMRTKRFAALLREAVQDRLTLDLVPKALNRLESVLDSDTANARVVVDASKAVLDRTGFPAAAPAKPELDTEAAANMTVADLEKRIAFLQNELYGSGRMVDGIATEVSQNAGEPA